MPHPLAQRLIQDLRGSPNAPVLDFAAGRGRNSAALRAAGFNVTAIDDAAAESGDPFGSAVGPFAAAISTHGLLHGTRAGLEERLRALAQRLQPRGRLYATFGSVSDARFGSGTRIDETTFAPAEGDERGVPHTFFSAEQLRAMLERWFTVASMEERAVDDIAGAWAHRERSLSRAVHWFVVAALRSGGAAPGARRPTRRS
jgi:hypothetical protein